MKKAPLKNGFVHKTIQFQNVLFKLLDFRSTYRSLWQGERTITLNEKVKRVQQSNDFSKTCT